MGEKSIQSYIIDDELNLKQIVQDYSGYIFIIIKNMAKDFLNNEDIEELISDVLLVVWKNKDELKLDMPLKPYIAGVTKNIVKNRLRGLKMPNDTLDDKGEIQYSSKIDYILETKEEFEIISKELDKMGEDGKIFIMFYYYGKKSKDIANELGYTESNINTKLHRIKKNIKMALEKRGYYYGK
jgi:RNA polymerase sigma-70 factor (ECF subfamily)